MYCKSNYLCIIIKANKKMTKVEFKKIATSKLESLTINDLIVELKKLQGNYSDSAALLESAILDILDLRMESEEFIKLCSEL